MNDAAFAPEGLPPRLFLASLNAGSLKSKLELRIAAANEELKVVVVMFWWL
jgi:hypothetical protein